MQTEHGTEGRDDNRGRGGSRGGSRGPFGARRPRPPVDLVLDYRDPETLKPFITEHGKIVPRRISKLTAKQQRNLCRQVKRARQLGIIGYSNQFIG